MTMVGIFLSPDSPVSFLLTLIYVRGIICTKPNNMFIYDFNVQKIY